MRRWKIVLVDILRRPLRAVVLFLTIAVIALAMLFGRFIQTIAQVYYDCMMQETGYSIGVFPMEDDAPEIAAAYIDAILSLLHVAGVNQSISCFAQPLSFSNVPYPAEGVYTRQADSELIFLVGSKTAALYQTFRDGTMALIEGVWPSETAPGVLVDQALAAENQLALGDAILLQSNLEERAVELPIVGIYEALQSPKVSEGAFETVCSSSFLFCDLDTYQRVDDLRDTRSFLYVYVDRYQNVPAVLEEISALDANYTAIDVLQADLDGEGDGRAAVTILSAVMDRVLALLGCSGVVILSLVTLLWVREHYRETGIYVVLGFPKWKITLLLLSQVTLLALCSSIFSGAVGIFALRAFGAQLFHMALSVTQSSFSNTALQQSALHTAQSVTTVLCAQGQAFLTVLAAAPLPCLTVTRLEHRRLFSDQMD